MSAGGRLGDDAEVRDARDISIGTYPAGARGALPARVGAHSRSPLVEVDAVDASPAEGGTS